MPVDSLFADKDFQRLTPGMQAATVSGLLAKDDPAYAKLDAADQAKVTVGIMKNRLGNKADLPTLDHWSKQWVAGEGLRKAGGIEGVVKKAVSSPETALRTIPPILTQTAGAVVGGKLGGEPGAVAGGAAASVLNDYYERFLNHMYGEPNKPATLAGETTNAVLGGLMTEAPRAVKAATGLSGAEKIAQTAAAGAREESGALAAKVTEAESAVAAEKQRIAGQATQSHTAAGKEAVAKTHQATEKIQDGIDQSKAKLRAFRGKSIEGAREDTANQVGTQQVQQMVGKTPQQLQAQEAAGGDQFAAQRSAAQAPVFDGAQAYHAEVGRAFEPFIGPHKDEPIEGEGLDALGGAVASVKSNAEQRGQNISDPELNKIMARLEEASAPPEIDLNKILSGKGAKGGSLQLSNADLAKIEAAQEGKQASALTIGEAWGLRGRLGRVMAKSPNPAVRLSAYELMDKITSLMPDVPDKVRQAYATERSQFPPSVMREVATARNPAEVGKAIYGSPTSPEPAQVALNLIRRAKTPDQIEGLRTAFADNWLSKPHNPDDIGRFNPQVIKELYGKDAAPIFKLLGPEGSVKSSSWQKLIAIDPNAKAALLKAQQDAIRSETGKALQEAISKGERALRDSPDAFTAYQAVIKGVKTPEGKLQALMDAAQKAQDKVAQAPTEKEAAVAALGKRGLAPDSRLERMALAGLAFRAYFALAGSGGAIAKHPEMALGIGGLLGGRGIIRVALSNPKIASAYVNMIDLAANPKNATSVGNILGQLTAASALQYVKDKREDNQ